ncbi:hypothetical protein ABRY94_11870 [Castellaniella ginsengisoli]|uniref:Uncharacterized protein n=1 Tax=Castellaniella ginsengisoli TaxID=546114 RepID=A0AB39ESC5_9BURK
MSDLTIILIGAAVFGAGYVVGHIHALVSYHKRRPMRQEWPIDRAANITVSVPNQAAASPAKTGPSQT